MAETRTEEPSRRKQHKLRTQRALQQAALELFSSQGYDSTTTEEVAEKAGVSPRTFFRYFATKESVLWVGEFNWFQAATAAYLQQPAALTDFEALRETLLATAPGLEQARPSLLLYEASVASSPTLRGRVQERQQTDIGGLAEAIAARRKLKAPNESCSLLAAVGLLAFRRAINRWLAGPESVDAAQVISDEFRVLGELFD